MTHPHHETPISDQTCLITPPMHTLWLQLLTFNTLYGAPFDSRTPDATQALAMQDIERVIEAGCALQFETLSLIGGDPVLSPLLEPTLALAASRTYQRIELISPLNVFPQDVSFLLRSHKCHVVTWIYSHKSRLHEAITKDGASWAATLHAIETCLSEGIDLTVLLPVTDLTRRTLEETALFLCDLGIPKIKILADGMRSAVPENKSTVRHACVWANGEVSSSIIDRQNTQGSLHHGSLYATLQGLNEEVPI